MIDHSNSIIEKVSVHNIGNKNNGEELYISNSLLDVSDGKVKDLLSKFFLSPFSDQEYYSFTFTNNDVNLNPLYVYASEIFENIKAFHKNSVNIAKHIYEVSVHPQIKPGDLFVAYFREMVIEDEVTDVIGIFKSENKVPFLKINRDQKSYSIRYEDGINVEKLDKGCLIFNSDKESGYKLCLVDKSSKGAEAQFWKDSFLQVKPYIDVYHYTKDLMNVTKQYIIRQLNEDFELDKTDQIAVLKRSAEYFRNHDSFDKEDYEKEVFRDSAIIKSFRKFDESYRSDNNIDYEDNFEFSPSAVKQGLKLFKSVLKLDKNFHIYIHGGIEMIKQGVEKDGRKFYKIYYENEV